MASRFLSAVCVFTAIAAAGHAVADQPPVPSQTLELTPDHVARLRAYHAEIARVAAGFTASSSLAEAVRPVLTLAGSRSEQAEADPAEENRAAILALAFYANGRSLAVLVPEARAWPTPRPRRLLLRNRNDLARHFMVSAALAAAAGEPLANALGLYKEIEDARRGSGFSFADLAADRSGTRFGHLATRAADSARQLQSVVAAALVDEHLMPAPWDLPEGLDEATFARRYRDTSSPAYRAMIEDIDRRIAMLPLFRTMGRRDVE